MESLNWKSGGSPSGGVGGGGGVGGNKTLAIFLQGKNTCIMESKKKRRGVVIDWPTLYILECNIYIQHCISVEFFQDLWQR